MTLSEYAKSLTKEQLIRRLDILLQVATELNNDLAEVGWADEDGFVNTCSTEDAGVDGNIGTNIVNLHIIADYNNPHVEEYCMTDAEYEAKKKSGE